MQSLFLTYISALRIIYERGEMPDVTRNSTIHPVSIGNGLFARTSRPETMWEAHLRRQRTCEHTKRDQRGTCYRCGHRMPCEQQEAFGG